MNNSPVILIYSGKPDHDEIYRAGVAEHFPDLTILTANSAEEVQERLPQAEILFAWTFPVEFLTLSENLRWFQVMGTGLDSLAKGPKLPEHVKITNIKGVFGPSMAEYALAYMFTHTQKIRQAVRNQEQGRWVFYVPGRLRGTTVGVAGLGSIGREVVNRCHALGMHVIGLRRSPGEVENVSQVYTFNEVDQFLPQCDFLVCAMPHTRETVGMFSPERLRLLKPDCFLVNMGRGTLYKEEDLAEALRDGVLAGAAIDVFPTEPLPEDSPLWSLDNIYITPHVSGTNRPEELIPPFVDNLGRYLRGEPLINVADLTRGY